MVHQLLNLVDLFVDVLRNAICNDVSF